MTAKYILIPKVQPISRLKIPQPLTLLLDNPQGSSPIGLNMSPLFLTL